MKNISNQEIDAKKCTQCSSCGKRTWYVMKCDCGHIFCRYCSAEHADDGSDCIILKCPKCGKSMIYA